VRHILRRLRSSLRRVTIPEAKLALVSVSAVALSPEPRRSEREVRQAAKRLHLPGTFYVVLSPAVPKVEGRGWLEFSADWQISATLPGGERTGVAQWSRGSGRPTGGSMEVGLTGLTPQTQFGMMVNVACEPSSEASNPKLEFRLFAGVADPTSGIWSEEDT